MRVEIEINNSPRSGAVRYLGLDSMPNPSDRPGWHYRQPGDDSPRPDRIGRRGFDPLCQRRGRHRRGDTLA